jgi:hypothetical protein
MLCGRECHRSKTSIVALDHGATVPIAVIVGYADTLDDTYCTTYNSILHKHALSKAGFPPFGRNLFIDR